MTDPVCGCCGSTPLLPKYQIGVHRIVSCPRCRVVQLEHRLSIQDIKQFYASGYFAGESELGYANYRSMAAALKKNFRRRASDLAGRIGGKGRVLEIGAGYGFFIEACRMLGLDAAGVEPSGEAVAWASSSLGITLHHTTLEEFPVGDPVDALVAWDVIEHLRDPRVFLESAARRIKSGGWLALTTGDFDTLAARLSGKHWHLFNLPEHLFFFSAHTLSDLLTQHELRVASVSHPGNDYTIAYLLERLLKKGWGALPPGFFTQDSWMQRATVPVNLGDIMLVYARKT